MQIERRETPTVMDGLVIRYKIGKRGEISASRNGVAISGTFPIFNTTADMMTVGKVLSQAYEDACCLHENRMPAVPSWAQEGGNDNAD